MRHVLLTGAIAALALAGPTTVQAQVYIVEPGVAAAPAYVSPYSDYAAAPVVVAPRYVAPPVTYVAPPTTYVTPGYYDYGYAPQPYVSAPLVSDGYTTVDAYTGRQCTVKPDGYRWCWTP